MTTTDEQQRIERTIIKTYRKTVWQPFVGALKSYQLIEKGDRIAVCVSGGKDSLLLAKCMQQLHRHSEVPFELCFLAIDPGYSEDDRAQLMHLCETLGIPLTLREVPLFRIVSEQTDGSPCYLCARMRRGWLYKLASELGCNKIALGHHLDEVVETALMSMLYGAEIKTMMPKLKASNYDGMELIRPLYAVRERDILLWKNNTALTFLHSGCPLGESGCGGSKRAEMKALVQSLRATLPDADKQLFRSLHNVNIGMVPAYREGDNRPLIEFTQRYGEVASDEGTI